MLKENVGILLPVSSLPGRHGIGDFGPSSFRFIRWLKQNQYRYWQILPLNPLGPGYSPYMSSCSNAIDFRYIDLDDLVKKGYLKHVPSFRSKAKEVDYYRVGLFKEKYLYKAYLSFCKQGKSKQLEQFMKKYSWVKYYATFEFFKKRNDLKAWNEWNSDDRDYFIHHSDIPSEYKKEIEFIVFIQYIALKQWLKVLNYARRAHILIISDMPFYVGFDSIECWMNRDQFAFDENNQQTEVGGVPPDAFSEGGQLWGSPIYRFDKMKENGYSLLVDRTGYLASMCDYLRLDHFRAFDTYYVIPAGMPDAKIGEWRIGPRDDFFEKLYEKYPNTKLIAEDLGDLFPSVLELRDRLNLPGMFIAEFTIFDPNQVSNDKFIVYPGTHDNETLWGWYNNLQEKDHQYLLEKFKCKESELYDKIFEYMYLLPSLMTIFPLQDLLKLGNEARLNAPGTVGYPNFVWKLRDWNFVNKIKYPKIR